VVEAKGKEIGKGKELEREDISLTPKMKILETRIPGLKS